MSILLLVSSLSILYLLSNAESLICPLGTVQIGEINADINTCGLEGCDNRYMNNYQTIQDCQNGCIYNNNCKSFTWSPYSGDPNHPTTSVCTLYNSAISTGQYGNQIMCRPMNFIRLSVNVGVETYFIRHDNFYLYIAESDGSNSFIQVSTFDKIDALNGAAGYVSFQSVNFPNYYINHNDFRVLIQEYQNNDAYKTGASWKEIAALNGRGGYASYESTYNGGGYYMRHSSSEIWISQNNGGSFLDDASWNIQYTSHPIPPCPSDTQQIGVLNSDINTCGLEGCDNRYSDRYQTIDDCYNGCIYLENCVSFTFAPYGGDPNHPTTTVCTLYNSAIPTGQYGNQIMCRPFNLIRLSVNVGVETYFIRHDNFYLYIAKSDGSNSFIQVSTFDKIDALNGVAGYVSFQSVNFPNYYINHNDFKVLIQEYQNNDVYKAGASWKEIAALNSREGDASYESTYNGGGFYMMHDNYAIYIRQNPDAHVASWTINIPTRSPTFFTEAPTPSPTIPTSSPSPAPTQPTAAPFNVEDVINSISIDRDFILINQTLSINAAKQACKDEYGTDLASIHSATEQEIVTNLCSGSNVDVCWLGGYGGYLNPSCNFKWDDDTTYDYTPTFDINEGCGTGQPRLCIIKNKYGLHDCSEGHTGYPICNNPKIEVNSVSNGLDPSVLYCGENNKDEPLWAGLLSLNEDLLQTLIDIKSEDIISSIFEYIECSESIYALIVRSIDPYSKPIQLANQIMDIMKKIPGVDGVVNDAVNAINNVIFQILNGYNDIVPDFVDVSWSNYHTDTSEIFNPFELVHELGLTLSTLVCDEIIGSDLNRILETLRDCQAMEAIKQEFNNAIYAMLTETDSNNALYNLFDSNLKTELLTNDYYKQFSIGTTIGMKICFSKGITGCITRMHGVSINLNGDSKIFESRSINMDLPKTNIGLEISGFVHFDFLSNYMDIINDKTLLNIGLKVQTKGFEAIENFINIWSQYSDKLEKIPYVGDWEDFMNGVDFINGAIDSNPLIIDILSGGVSARLSILYALRNRISDAALINCNGFRIDISIGDIDSFGIGVFIGYEYRSEPGTIKLNEYWQNDVEHPNFNSITNIIWDIAEDQFKFNIFGEAFDLMNIKLLSMTQNVIDTVRDKSVDIIETGLNNVIDTANIGINAGNIVISSVNNAVNGISGNVRGVKSDCESTLDSCEDFGVYDVCIDDIISITDVCDLFDPFIHAFDTIPDAPSIPLITRMNLDESYANSAHQISMKMDQNDYHDINDDDDDEKKKHINIDDQDANKKHVAFKMEIPNMFYVLFIIYTVIMCLCGAVINNKWRKRMNQHQIISYLDTDTEFDK